MVDFTSSSYGSITREDDEMRHDGASTASPESGSVFATSPSAFLSLSDHTFTPLSMADSMDDGNSEVYWENERDTTMYDVKRAFGISSSPSKGLTHIDAAIRTATRPTRPLTAGRGAGSGMVSSLVQSIEHLHATTSPGPQSPQQYELAAPNNIGSNHIAAHNEHQKITAPFLSSPNSSRHSSPSRSLAQQSDTLLLRKRDGQAPEARNSSPPLAPQNPLDLHHDPQQATARVPCTKTEPPNIAGSRRTPESVQASEGTIQTSPALFGPKPGAPSTRPEHVSPSAVATHASDSANTTTTTSDITRARTASICSVPICHPTPDLNPRSGSCLGNIAALEATAERFSLTSSIEDAIREAHEELKRSDSRRSSILRANSVRAESEDGAGSSVLSRQLSAVSRQSSILGINSLARQGGYSPAGYVSTPIHSRSRASSVYRSVPRKISNSMASKSHVSSPTAPTAGDEDMNMDISEEAGNGENFPTFLSRHGSVSVRSVVSSRRSLAEITELPMTLTQEALDEADRAEAAGESEDEDTIRASAHQYAAGLNLNNTQTAHADDEDNLVTPQPDKQPLILKNDFFQMTEPAPLQLHQPGRHYDPYETYDTVPQERERPASSGSGTTYNQAQNAFGDFDGVHCDPETLNYLQGPHQQDQQQQYQQQQHEHIQEGGQAGEQGEEQQQQQEQQQHQYEAMDAQSEPSQQQEQRKSRVLPADRSAVRSARPQSYFDMDTGQQMLYYPARVPAMLNLPPKLSKSGNKPTARQKVRSQVLSVIAPDARESRIWLPDPLAGLGASNTSLTPDGEFLNADDPAPARASIIPGSPENSQELFPIRGSPQQPVDAVGSPGQREIRRPQKLGGADARKSRMTVASELPAHLRASVFFDLPSEAPQIVVKDHSAIATLDSILDASASAPVSAFIDHAYAGKLGSEVYGIEKKKKANRKSRLDMDHKRSQSSATDLTVIGPKKRASFMSLLGPGRKSSENLGADTRRNTLAVGDNGRQRASSADSSSRDGQSPNVEQGLFSPDPDHHGSDSDEDPDKEDEEESNSDDDEEDDDEEQVFNGPPTTLLAELQLRKQRNKLRTRPVQRVLSNGYHSTLLELDTVAQVQRDMRKQMKVSLAWEDPALNQDLLNEEDDEEIPLAMLAAAKAAAAAKGVNRSTLDISAVLDEVNRPLGLMERREQEENEPLSRRRDRLQGRTPRETMNLETMQKRMTTLNLIHGGGATNVAGLRSQSRLALPLQNNQSGMFASSVRANSVAGDVPEPEVEGETLAERRKRMHGSTLPQTRPVSGAFSLELLSQFGGDDKDSQAKGNAVTPTSELPEESETLGQRRRRLQAEREAREQEMGKSLGAAGAGAGGQRLSRRTSMADVLAAHPLEDRAGAVDPREAEQIKMQTEAERVQREQEAKMARLRAQMPQTLPVVGHGAYTGAYRGAAGFGDAGRSVSGRYGIPDVPRPAPVQRMTTMPAGYGVPSPFGAAAHSVYGGGLGAQSAYNLVPAPAAYGAANSVYGAGMHGGAQSAYNLVPAPAAYGAPYNAYDYSGVPPAQQVDMVERWRQSIQPS